MASKEFTIEGTKVTLVANQADLEFKLYRWTQVFVAGRRLGAVCAAEEGNFSLWEYWDDDSSLDLYFSATAAIAALVKAHGGER